MSPRGTALFLAMLAAGYVAGKILADLQPFPPNRNTEAFTSFNPEKTLTALSNMTENFVLVARRNPLETVLWLAFAAVGAARGLRVMFGNPPPRRALRVGAKLRSSRGARPFLRRAVCSGGGAGPAVRRAGHRKL